MSVYVLTLLAKADIFDVWAYIAENNETAADRVEQAIYDACAVLAEGPQRGHTRPHAAFTSFLDIDPAIPTTPLFTGQTRPRFRSSPFYTASGTSGAFSSSARKVSRD